MKYAYHDFAIQGGCSQPRRGLADVAFIDGRSDVAFSRNTPMPPARLRAARLVQQPHVACFFSYISASGKMSGKAAGGAARRNYFWDSPPE
jgi:hypothetical protein